MNTTKRTDTTALPQYIFKRNTKANSDSQFSFEKSQSIVVQRMDEYRKIAIKIENELSWVKDSVTLTNEEVLEKEEMLSKKKLELVRTVYKKHHPRAKDTFCFSGGYYRSKAPVFYAKTEEALLEKLYGYYFKQDLETIFYRWLDDYGKRGVWDPKTIQEHDGIWRNHIAPFLGDKRIGDVTKSDIKRLFHVWTGKGLITKHAFVNYRSTLNGVFSYASDQELIPYNIVPEIDTRTLRFKALGKKVKAYTPSERQLLIAYLNSVPSNQRDGYYFAIKLALFMPLRFGEIAGIRYSDIDFEKGILSINQQMRNRVKNVTVDTVRNRVLADAREVDHKAPKGNPAYSVRKIPLTKTAVRILKEAHLLNPFGENLFMLDGRLLNTDTFNDHLKAFETRCGLPYLSSHKLRFTVASILYDGGKGMDITDLQKILGHSNVSMTLHYVEAYTGNEVEARRRMAADMEKILDKHA